MKLKKFLEEIKNYPEDFEMVMHYYDEHGRLHIKPINSVDILVGDKKLSCGTISFREKIYKELKKRGYFQYEEIGSYDELLDDH